MLLNRTLVYLDEASWGGDKEKEGKLKALVTEDTVIIEHKGREAIVQKNFVRLIFSSNNKWVVAAGDRERRFCVLDVGDGVRGNTGYFAAMADQMDSGGLEALMFLLQNRDLSGVDLRDFPRTSALDDQKRRSFDALQGWWNDCLSRGSVLPNELDPHGHYSEWDEPVPIEKCYQSLAISAKNRQVKNHLSETEFGIELRKLVAVKIKKQMFKNEALYGDGPVRKNCYIFPDLNNCRIIFDDLMGTNTDWPEVE